MITRHHLALTLICGLIPCTALEWTDPVLIIAVLAGLGVGTILPDVHMKRPAKNRLLTIAWLITRAGRILIIPVMHLMFCLITGSRLNPDDKRIVHSLPGIILYGTLCTCPVLAVGILFPGWFSGTISLAFSGGIFAGLVLHLVQDLCTRKGIALLYPFAGWALHGSIRPCDIHDPRILRFHIQYVLFFFVFQFALLLSVLPESFSLSWGCLGAALCIVLMVWQSDVQIEQVTPYPVPVNDGVEG